MYAGTSSHLLGVGISLYQTDTAGQLQFEISTRRYRHISDDEMIANGDVAVRFQYFTNCFVVAWPSWIRVRA